MSLVRETWRGDRAVDPAGLQQVAQHDDDHAHREVEVGGELRDDHGPAHSLRIRACSGCGRAAPSGCGSTAVTEVISVKSARGPGAPAR